MKKQHVEFSSIYPVESYVNIHFTCSVSAIARGETVLGFRERTRLSVYLICDLNGKSKCCYSNQLAVKCLQILIGLRKFFF